MATTSNPSVFISYAHQDASDIACRLQQDIAEAGCEVWLDVPRLSGGTSWTAEIERALDASEVVLALLSRGSFLSDTCRAEQLRSLRTGKCVIPILTQQDADRPIHLETRQYLDFSRGESYPEKFQQLLGEIWRREGATLSPQFRRTYSTVPPLPANFIERPQEMAALRAAVIGDGGTRRIALTALKGMAGIGKTVLAQALCLDEITQAAFPDGVIWLSVGKDPRDLLPLFRETARAIGDPLDGYDTLQSASNRLRTGLRDKAVLIVLDDVWDARDAAPFLMDAPRSRLMITTRDARIAAALGANQQELDVFTWEQSRQLIALWANCDLDKLPPEADEIIRECDNLPLAVAMVGAQLRGKPDRWKNVLQKLRNADLDRIRQSFPDYPHPDLLRAIEVSLEALTEEQRTRYLDFAVFPEDASIPEAAVRTLWRLDQFDTEDAVDQLVDLSLLTRDESKRLRVHDLLLDYLRRRLGTERLVERHNELLQSYFQQAQQHWSDGPRDGYFFENLVWHLRNARRADEALQLLSDFRWLDAKLRACGVVSLLADFEWYGSRDENARLLQETLRLSAHVLNADHDQLAGQLLGRLVPALSPAIDALREQAEQFSGSFWLRPLRQLLTQPGGALLYTLAGHSSRVRDLALTPEGARALSASDDHTIRVWDLRRGTLERTLTGHSDYVRAVTVLPDGQKAVSAADDHTLRVWDLSTGSEQTRIDTQTDWIRLLVSLPGAARVASVSDDRAIKIWNLQSGAVDAVLRGHVAEINCLALSPDGRALISASDDRSVRIWRLDTPGTHEVLKGHRARITALAIAGDRVLSVSADGVALLWNLPSGGKPQQLGWKAEGVRHATFTPSGNAVLAAGDDCNVHLWPLDTPEKGVLEGHSDWVNRVAVTPDGRRAVSASDDGTLKVWAVSRVASAPVVRDHADRVRAVTVTPDEMVLSTSDDHTLRIWDVAKRSVQRIVSNHHHWVIGCTPDGSKIVSVASEGRCYVWELVSGDVVQEFHGHHDRVRCIAVAPCGTRVVSGGDDGTLRVWSIESGREIHCIRFVGQWARAVVVTADSRRALTACDGPNLKLWDLENGAEISTLRGHGARINTLALSSHGELLVSGSDDHTLRLWQLDQDAPIRVLEGHTGHVNAVAFLPGDERIVSAADDGDLRVWDVSRGVTVARFTAESPLLTCAVGARSPLVIAGDRLGLVHFLSLTG